MTFFQIVYFNLIYRKPLLNSPGYKTESFPILYKAQPYKPSFFVNVSTYKACYISKFCL